MLTPSSKKRLKHHSVPVDEKLPKDGLLDIDSHLPVSPESIGDAVNSPLSH